VARPRIDVPEASQRQVLQLSAEGKKLLEICGITGLKYHVVRRILADAKSVAGQNAQLDLGNTGTFRHPTARFHRLKVVWEPP
jgi:hypothetical protein